MKRVFHYSVKTARMARKLSKTKLRLAREIETRFGRTQRREPVEIFQSTKADRSPVFDFWHISRKSRVPNLFDGIKTVELGKFPHRQKNHRSFGQWSTSLFSWKCQKINSLSCGFWHVPVSVQTWKYLYVHSCSTSIFANRCWTPRGGFWYSH